MTFDEISSLKCHLKTPLLAAAKLVERLLNFSKGHVRESLIPIYEGGMSSAL